MCTQVGKKKTILYVLVSCTQHNHDKYSLQTKGQKPVDKEIFRKVNKILS